MNKLVMVAVAFVIGIGFQSSFPNSVSAEDFYKGKSIRFVVGFAAGGGYDLAARLVSRHIPKHIPGNPSVVVENMTGAGSLIAANYTYKGAKADGLTVGIWNGAYVLRQALGDKAVRLDGRKLGWIGAPTKGTPVCAIMAHSGLKSFEDILKSNKRIKMGATRAGSTYDDLPKILNKVLNTKFDVISGYTGTGTISVAMRSKEVDGGCQTWESMRTTMRAMLDAEGEDKMIPFLIHSRWEDPEVKDVPLIPEIIKGDDNIAMYRAWIATYEFQRPFAVPPGTPKERLSVLRAAFAATMKDPEFLAEAEKSKLDVTYVTPEQIATYVEQIMAMTPKAKESLQFLVRKSKK
ncbi:MAG: tripartite tricarboxylate transporter substrate-binding protein [Deltaproteobacteria bacterium]|nr:tripartite tricarboxylate transporter substrate-binding protein [Deltaproteobacteria bacterium]